jgi:glutathione S-transferase
MIDLHYAPTPNGWKISIMLEELGLPYTVIPVNIRAGDQFKPEFLAISPNNRIPAIVDHAPAEGGEPFSVFETGAILIYLADKTGRFLPKETRARSNVMQWLMWQMIIPTSSAGMRRCGRGRRCRRAWRSANSSRSFSMRRRAGICSGRRRRRWRGRIDASDAGIASLMVRRRTCAVSNHEAQ